jgi:deltex-like protein
MLDPTEFITEAGIATNTFWFSQQKSTSIDDILEPYTFKDEHDVCAVCFDNDSVDTVKLQGCSEHGFHKACISTALKANNKCPVCQHVYNIGQIGNQPLGSMFICFVPSLQLPGEDIGAYIVKYLFPSGIQSDVHYHPSRPYTGTKRMAFFPASLKGKHVIGKLMQAWDARRIFTIGTSLTTGIEDCVIWNCIHHKTTIHGGPVSFGYPDAGYLDRVLSELADVGL